MKTFKLLVTFTHCNFFVNRHHPRKTCFDRCRWAHFRQCQNNCKFFRKQIQDHGRNHTCLIVSLPSLLQGPSKRENALGVATNTEWYFDFELCLSTVCLNLDSRRLFPCYNDKQKMTVFSQIIFVKTVKLCFE